MLKEYKKIRIQDNTRNVILYFRIDTTLSLKNSDNHRDCSIYVKIVKYREGIENRIESWSH